MYFTHTTPEAAGISSRAVLRFLKVMEKYNFRTHSVIMSRGKNIFLEAYYKPFHKDYKHRMYSVSKSFVSVAVGFAVEDGLLSLDDKMVSFFPDYVNENTNELTRATTIRDMLMMQTAYYDSANWFTSGTGDRTEVYFRPAKYKIPGTLFNYDSPGSYMLGVIVEKLTGKPFLEYLKEKFLLEIGFSHDAYCLKVPGGHSWGDSGVMCTSLDLLHFARFVLNGGVWNSKSYMHTDYLKDAVKPLAATNKLTNVSYNGYGYGYQIWGAPRGGFAFIGMGDQFAICDPITDFIFVINSDNQGASPTTRDIMYHELYTSIVEELGEPLCEDSVAYNELQAYVDGRTLFALKQEESNEFEGIISGRRFFLEPNEMNIDYIQLDFEGKRGTLKYKNKQGEKELAFGLGYNEFGVFPQEGYSDKVGTEFVPGHHYKCANSADWQEEKKLRIFCQIIDKYFGNATFILSFKDNGVTVQISKTAEYFLTEYQGYAIGFEK